VPAVITPFAPRFSANASGDILFVANTLLTAPSSDAGAAAARNGTGTRLNNNDFSMVHVDVDSNASTFNSSRADLALPAGFDLDSAVPSQGTYDPLTGAWALGTVAPATAPTLVLTATVTSAAASVASSSIAGADQFDPIVGNNLASVAVAP
jgi:hypothetical protein